MNISSNYQLVPCNQGLRHVTAYRHGETGTNLRDRRSAARRYALWPPAHPRGYKIQSWNQESVYISSRQINAHKINQVGLLIDIYA